MLIGVADDADIFIADVSRCRWWRRYFLSQMLADDADGADDADDADDADIFYRRC